MIKDVLKRNSNQRRRTKFDGAVERDSATPKGDLMKNQEAVTNQDDLLNKVFSNYQYNTKTILDESKVAKEELKTTDKKIRTTLKSILKDIRSR